MNTRARLDVFAIALQALTALSLALVPSLAAQTAATGTITGQISNAVTGEFLRNAEVRVPGTNLTSVSGDGGTYTLSSVPAGPATVVVYYTGYPTGTMTVNVPAGGTVTQNFDLASASAGTAAEAVKLDAFVVQSEREGDAKAIMAQRNSMNITNSVASDVFGDVPGGNVGQFLKYLPGIDLEQSEGDVRAPRLRGMDPAYTNVSIDGLKTASADAAIIVNGSDNGTDARAFGFDSVSISAIESIEVSYTASADMDASSTAGRINLKTKRAFDRKDRRIAYQANVNMNSEDMVFFRSTRGPGPREHFKPLPGGQLEFSDAFLDHRLGVTLNLSLSNVYDQQRYFGFTYNTAATAADPRPYVLTAVSLRDGPKISERLSGTLTVDYKVTPNFNIGLSLLYSWYRADFYNRIISFTATRANTSGDGLTHFDYANATYGYTDAPGTKETQTYTYLPRFEYKRGPLSVVGTFSLSTSRQVYGDFFTGVATPQATFRAPVGVHVERDGLRSSSFRITQFNGPDFADPANLTNPRVTRTNRNQYSGVSEGSIDAKLSKSEWNWPSYFKTGIKASENGNVFDNKGGYDLYQWVGPGGGTTGDWGLYPSAEPFDPGRNGYVRSLSGKDPVFLDTGAIAGLSAQHPEYLAQIATPANFKTAYVDNHRSLTEWVRSAYVMGGTKVRKLQLEGGLRWEGTWNEFKSPFRRPPAEVVAAGYPVSSGVATTVPGLIYQYLTLPEQVDSANHAEFFPSASVKYPFSDRLVGQMGASRTIKRPPYQSISGVWSIDDVNRIITAPNPSLKSEYAYNYDGRLSYYFEPVGSLSVSGFQKEIMNQRVTSLLTADEFGNEDPAFDTYLFRTTTVLPNLVVWRGWSLDYRQSLSFLPALLRRTQVSASYTRNTASTRTPGLRPHILTGTISTRIWKFNGMLKARYADDMPYTTTVGRFGKQRTMLDCDFGYDFSRRLQLFVSGNNITNEPDYFYQNGDPTLVTSTRYYGAKWVAGIKGAF